MLRAEKKWDESIKLFENSLQQWEALEARKWYVYVFARMVLYEYARVYLERDQEGDREKAHSLLNQALEIFEQRALRMVGWPAVIYATVDLKLTSELSNRQWIITPERAPEKWEAACARSKVWTQCYVCPCEFRRIRKVLNGFVNPIVPF